MKKFAIVAAISVLVILAFTYSRSNITSIYGSIDPAESVSKVMAIKDKDTLVVIPHDGIFSIKVTSGTWKLYFTAVSPYQDMYADNIKVVDDLSTNVGVIRLKKNGD